MHGDSTNRPLQKGGPDTVAWQVRRLHGEIPFARELFASVPPVHSPAGQKNASRNRPLRGSQRADLHAGGTAYLEGRRNVESIIQAKRITAIIRDDGPMVICGDAPTYRRVTFDLTGAQQEELRLYATATSGGKPIFESLSKLFWEI